MLFESTVVYCPSLWYYAARGWGEDALLKGAIHTPNSIRGPLTLRACGTTSTTTTATATSPSPLCIPITVDELKQEALRSLLLAHAAGLAAATASRDEEEQQQQRGEEGIGSDTAEATTTTHVQQIEDGVVRWAGLAHLKWGAFYITEATVDGGNTNGEPTTASLHVTDGVKQIPPRRGGGGGAGAAAGPGHGGDMGAVAQQHLQQQQQQQSRVNGPSSPLWIPSSANGTLLQVLYQREDEWRAQRRAHHEKKAMEQLRNAAAEPPGEEEMPTTTTTTEAKTGDEEEEEAHRSNVDDDASGVFACEDDASFSAWLAARRTALVSWYRHHHTRQSRASPCPATAITAGHSRAFVNISRPNCDPRAEEEDATAGKAEAPSSSMPPASTDTSSWSSSSSDLGAEEESSYNTAGPSAPRPQRSAEWEERRRRVLEAAEARLKKS